MAVKKAETPVRAEVPVRKGAAGLSTLRDEVNHLFDRFSGVHWPHWGRRREGGDWPAAPGSPWNADPFAGFDWPAPWSAEDDLGRADLSETDEGYELQIDLPGMKKEDISVELSDGILTVAGERADEREDKRKGYYLSERSYGTVRRSFRVPDSVRTDDVKAQFSDGVLTLTLPRTEEARRSARTIDIE
jgi:HSP20 family protein